MSDIKITTYDGPAVVAEAVATTVSVYDGGAGPAGPTGPAGVVGPIGPAGPASTVPGPTGPTGPTGVVAATAPATYDSGTQTVGVSVGTTLGTVAAGNDSRFVSTGFHANVKDYGAAGNGTTDDTAAIIAAMDACVTAGGGDVIFEAKTYLVNGSLRTDRHGNAIIPLPTSTRAPLRFIGVTPANQCDPRSDTGYTIVKTTKTGLTYSGTNGVPSLIGGATGDTNWLDSMVSFVNICFWLPKNPTIACADLRYVRRIEWDGCSVIAINTGDADYTQPTSVYAFALRTPDTQNYHTVLIKSGQAHGMYAGLVGSVEHCTIAYWVSKWCVIGWAPMTGGHGGAVLKMGIEWCQYHISGWSETAGVTSLVTSHTGDTKAQISVAELALEDATTGWYVTTAHINDSTNRLYGAIFFDRYNGTAPTSALTATGGSNLSLVPLLAPALTGNVPATRQVTAGTGLSGGGDLTADRSFAIDTTAEAERIRDVIGAALVAGSGVSLAVNDAGDTITVSSSGSGSGTLTIQDENGSIATSVTQIDFQGAGVTATSGTGEVIVTIPSSSVPLATRATTTSAATLTHAVDFPVAFESEDFDDLAAHDTVTNPSRFVASSTGRYRLTGAYGVATVKTLFLSIRKNGSTVMTYNTANSPGGGTTDGQAIAQISSGVLALAAGDYLEVIALPFKVSGGTTTRDTGVPAWACFERLG